MVTMRLSLLFIFSALICAPAWADENSRVTANVERKGADFSVTASVLLPVQPCQAYLLLTDYDSLPGYIPGILETRHERLANHIVKVWQRGEVTILFFSINLETLLEMEEIPNQRIRFKQLEGDLAAHSGEWALQEEGAGTRVLYKSTLTFNYYLPGFLGKPILEKELRNRFEAVATEAERRKNLGLLNCEPVE